MLEINKLSAAIHDNLPRDCEARSFLRISTEHCLTITPRITSEGALENLQSPDLKAEVVDLVAAIRQAIPDDITFELTFYCDFIGIKPTYDDGNAFSNMADEMYFKNRKYLLGNLKRTDWDEFRGSMIDQMGIFEELVNEAEDRPVNIPSSKEAAERYAKPLGKALEELRSRSPRPSFFSIYARDDEPLEIVVHQKKGEILWTMADCMTTQYDVLAVCSDGIDLPFDEIEKLKLRAVEGLGPISRAKAERRFGF